MSGQRLQTYRAPGIEVTFEPGVCSHSAVCLKSLPAVFDVRRSRWVRPQAATVAEVAAAIDRCPSGALQYVLERQAAAIRPTPLVPSMPAIVLENPVTGMSLRILRSAVESAGSLLEMEAFYPAGSAAPPPHFHPRQEEHFVILEGAMRAVVGGSRRGARRELAAGESLVIPAGESHSMWNPGPGIARVNWQVRPALRTQEFFAVVFALAGQGRVNAHGVPGLLDLALLMPHFQPEIQVTSPPAWVQRGLFGLLGPISRRLGRCPELRSVS